MNCGASKIKTPISKETTKGRADKPIGAGGHESEVEAYGFIRDRLKEIGWKVSTPSALKGGQVWTQTQCFHDSDIKKCFGLKRPENVVKLSEQQLWVIEAKASRREIAVALNEATDFYAARINGGGTKWEAILATGVAGNTEAGYFIQTKIRLDGKWRVVTINGKEATGFLSPTDVATLVRQKTSDVKDFEPPQRLFLQAAQRINEVFHVGGINKDVRAKTIAALLLAVLQEPPNLDTSLPVLIDDINARSKNIMETHGKPDFAPFVKIEPPARKKNHVKYRQALIWAIQELQNLNITSAMKSRTDVLGQFYEVFLKYGNGAKEIGIVLTPRHITRFAVEALGVSSKDIVLDPACGTGGFLVAAFDYVRSTSNEEQLERFKKNGLFGIEQQSYVTALAIVNMIFRGDGKNNITEGNCFTEYLAAKTIRGVASAEYMDEPPAVGSEPVTRVLMNPPFALKNSREKEYHFVQHALNLMEDGGLLFCLLPMNAMFGTKEERAWREHDLLKKHTLLSVVSLPHELFVPSALKQVVAIIVKKGVPHPKTQPVFWARVAQDGHLVVKKKRLLASELNPPRIELNQLVDIISPLKSFVAQPGTFTVNVSQLCKTAPIDFEDPLLELLPEAYLDNQLLDKSGLKVAVDEMAKEIIKQLPPAQTPSTNASIKEWAKVAPVTLDSIYDLVPGDYHNVSILRPGETPIISCGNEDNGIVGRFNVPSSKTYSHRLTVAFNGSPLTTKYHPYSFAAKDDVAVCIPKNPLRITTQLSIMLALNRERWRYSYYRKCFLAKLKRFEVYLPHKNGVLDEDAMQAAIAAGPYWQAIKGHLSPR